MYHVVFSKEALKQLKKLDKQTSKYILLWIKKNLEGCDEPRNHGKSLTVNRKGQWRYRIGNYRLICEISDDKLVILALSVGHRKEVYR